MNPTKRKKKLLSKNMTSQKENRQNNFSKKKKDAARAFFPPPTFVGESGAKNVNNSIFENAQFSTFFFFCARQTHFENFSNIFGW